MLQSDPFPSLNNRLREAQEAEYAAAGMTALRYAKFTIGGLPGEKHAVFIPENMTMSQALLAEICDAIGQEMPSMTLCGVSSMCHPSALTTPQLRECNGFREIMSEARSSLGLPSGVPEGLFACCQPTTARHAGLSGKGEKEDPAETRALQDFANSVLDKKVTAMVKSVANAAVQSNAWIFSGPLISSFEICLQRCYDTMETEVFSVVVAHLQDAAYKQSKLSMSLLKQLFENSDDMTHEVVSTSWPVALPGDLWNPEKNKANAQFKDYGYDFWSFEGPGDKQAKDHPVFQWPWPYANLFFMFYRPKSTGEPDWEYTTPKRLDKEALPLKPDQLAPSGYVFIGGDARVRSKLQQAIQVARPSVVLDNTPDVSKQMAIFLNVLKLVLSRPPTHAVKHFLVDNASSRLVATPTVAEMLAALSPAKVIKHIEKEFSSAGMDRGARITLSDVVGLLDLVKQRPQVFKETLQVVDPLRDHPEQVTNRLTSAFCNAYMGTMENGTVNGNLVMKGWRLHYKLMKSATQLKRFSEGLTILISLVMLVSTVLAVVLVYLRLMRAEFTETAVVTGTIANQDVEVQFTYSNLMNFLNALMLVLPITAGLLTTLQSHFGVAQKWASIHMAANQIVSEVFLFLASSGHYYVGRDGMWSKERAALHREKFRSRLQDIVTNMSMAGIREGDFMEGEDDQDMFAKDPGELQRHIQWTLYGIAPAGWLRRSIWEAVARYLPGKQSELRLADAGSTGAENTRDFTAPLNSEGYMTARIEPLIRCYNDRVKEMSKLRTKLNVAVFILLSVGTMLAVFGHSLWIPVNVAIATCFISFLQWLAPEESIAGMGNAVSQLNKLDLRWHGSSVSEQSSEHFRNKIVSATENVMLQVAATTTGAPLMPEDFDEGAFFELEPDAGYGAPSASRSRPLSRQGSRPGTPGTRTPGGSRRDYSRQVSGGSRPRSRSNSAPGTPRRGWNYR